MTRSSRVCLPAGKTICGSGAALCDPHSVEAGEEAAFSLEPLLLVTKVAASALQQLKKPRALSRPRGSV